MGGEADSTYEYFIKEHLLLGGAKDQYKDLYIKSVEAAERYLFFQPLAEGDPDILMSGKYTTFYKDDGTQGEGLLAGEMQHLVSNTHIKLMTDMFRRRYARSWIQNI
jgi:mannosyl-oligosaccharide alpha-1,2-mannosidase